LLAQSKIETLRKYISDFIQVFLGKAVARSDQSLKRLYSPMVSSEAFLTLNEANDFSFDFISTLMNITLSILAISYVIESRMIIAYCLSFFLAFVFLTLFRKKASNLSNRFQTSRINVQNILSQAWDNVLLGNSYSLNL